MLIANSEVYCLLCCWKCPLNGGLVTMVLLGHPKPKPIIIKIHSDLMTSLSIEKHQFKERREMWWFFMPTALKYMNTQINMYHIKKEHWKKFIMQTRLNRKQQNWKTSCAGIYIHISKVFYICKIFSTSSGLVDYVLSVQWPRHHQRP